MKQETKNIFCSVSAGYSSVLMAVKIKDWYPDHNIVFAMANTSKERVESLDFMNKAARYFDIDLKWIEASVDQERGKGTNFNIVSYSELKTKGELFEDGIKKYGIPSKINKWCNRELKLVPLKKYADSIFGLNNYSIAVGIRFDEIDRVSVKYKYNNVFYPLVEHEISTTDRNKFWHKQPIQIQIPAFKGNCDMCFEKSNRKILTTIREDRHLIDWWDRMERKYSKKTIVGKNSYNAFANKEGMNFFRSNNSAKDLISMSGDKFRLASDEYIYESNLFDSEGDCAGGCTVFN